jgi:hypothetical protein
MTVYNQLSLPNEIYIQVMLYLGPSEFQRAGRINRAWQEASKHAQFMQYVFASIPIPYTSAIAYINAYHTPIMINSLEAAKAFLSRTIQNIGPNEQVLYNLHFPKQCYTLTIDITRRTWRRLIRFSAEKLASVQAMQYLPDDSREVTVIMNLPLPNYVPNPQTTTPYAAAEIEPYHVMLANNSFFKTSQLVTFRALKHYPFQNIGNAEAIEYLENVQIPIRESLTIPLYFITKRIFRF